MDHKGSNTGSNAEDTLFIQMEEYDHRINTWSETHRWNFGLEQELYNEEWEPPRLPRVSAAALGELRYTLGENVPSTLMLLDLAAPDFVSVLNTILVLEQQRRFITEILMERVLSRRRIEKNSSSEREENEEMLLPDLDQEGLQILLVNSPEIIKRSVYLIRLRDPIDNALVGQTPVRFIFLVVGPKQDSNRGREMCSALGGVFCNPEFAMASLTARTQKEFQKLLFEALENVTIAPALDLKGWFKTNFPKRKLAKGITRNNGKEASAAAKLKKKKESLVEIKNLTRTLSEYASSDNVLQSNMQNKHLYIELNELHPIGWVKTHRWNFGLEEEQESAKTGIWRKPALPSVSVWSIVQLRLVLNAHNVIFDVSPTTVAGPWETPSRDVAIQNITESVLERLHSVCMISKNEKQRARSALLRRGFEDVHRSVAGDRAAPKFTSTLAPTESQEAILILAAAIDTRKRIFAFIRLTSAVDLKCDNRCMVRFVFLSLLPLSNNPSHNSKRLGYATSLGKVLGDMMCDEKLMESSLTCASSVDFLAALDHRMKNLSIVPNDAVFDSTPYSGIPREDSTKTVTKDPPQDNLTDILDLRANERNLKAFQGTEDAFVFKKEFPIEYFLVSQRVHQLRKKRQAYRWRKRQDASFADQGLSISTLLSWTTKYSIPLLLGVVLAMVLANVVPDWYEFYLGGVNSAEGTYCFGIGTLNETRTFLNEEEDGKSDLWGDQSCVKFFGSPVTFQFLVNEIFMCFFFALAAKEVKESFEIGGTLYPIQNALPAVVGAIGGITGPVVFFFVLYFLFQSTLPQIEAGDQSLIQAWAIPTASSVPLAWVVAYRVFGRGHPIVEFVLLMTLLMQSVAIILLAFFFSELSELEPIYLLLVIAAVVIAYIFRRCFRFNHYVLYFCVSGSISWAGLALTGIYPALALVPICLMMTTYKLESLPGVLAKRRNTLVEDEMGDMQDRVDTRVRAVGSYANIDVPDRVMSGNMRMRTTNDPTTQPLKHSQFFRGTSSKGKSLKSGFYELGALQKFEYHFEKPIEIGLFFFALVNAGVNVQFNNEEDGPFDYPITPFLLVALSLLLGKVFGIWISLWIVGRSGKLPRGVRPVDLPMIGLICSISLTLSLLFADKAFECTSDPCEAIVRQSKLAVLATSLLAGVLAVVLGKAFDFQVNFEFKKRRVKSTFKPNRRRRKPKARNFTAQYNSVPKDHGISFSEQLQEQLIYEKSNNSGNDKSAKESKSPSSSHQKSDLENSSDSINKQRLQGIDSGSMKNLTGGGLQRTSRALNLKLPKDEGTVEVEVCCIVVEEIQCKSLPRLRKTPKNDSGSLGGGRPMKRLQSVIIVIRETPPERNTSGHTARFQK